VDIDGILLINKEVGRTSFETVQLVRKRIGARKAGHTGTLDKSASGLLLICVNRATAIQNLLMGHFKQYRGTVRFGVETDTLDRYGHIVRSGSPGIFSDAQIQGVFGGFRGKIQQVPPVYSALHKNGERLYHLARSGIPAHARPREVEIKNLTLLKNGGSFIHIEVTASRGTYIRSLAHDIADSLGTCGYLAELHRFRIGSFSVENAITADEVNESTPLLSMPEALHDFPQVEVGVERASRVLHGVPAWQILKELGQELPQSEHLCLVNSGQLVAIVEQKPKPGYFKVFGMSDDPIRGKG
jgi:tRNA pseudouridine55 synthase